MQTIKFKTWKTLKPKQEKAKILAKWEFINDGRRGFAVYKGDVKPSGKEIEIIKILRSMELTFYKEVSFDMKRRFDFFIPCIDVVIEYDGYRHFQSIDAMKRDLSKDNQLKNLGVKILRYTKKDDLSSVLGIDLMKIIAGLKRFYPGSPVAGE